jgi:hypothetical protein
MDNGCETDLNTDYNNCGACGEYVTGGWCIDGVTSCEYDLLVPCSDTLSKRQSLNYKSAFCKDNLCELECEGRWNTLGYANCDGDGVNGCEINTATDSENCGGCGSPCLTGVFPSSSGVVCEQGICMNKCTIGFVDCDGMFIDLFLGELTNGCENCGACGSEIVQDGQCINGVPSCGDPPIECSSSRFINSATVACVSGLCSPSSCKPGFLICDSILSDGDGDNDIVGGDGDWLDGGAGDSGDLPIGDNCNGILCSTSEHLNSVSVLCNGIICKIENCMTGYLNCDGILSSRA